MTHNRKISITGLGYVGLTIATAFGQTQKVIGYDQNAKRIADLKAGIDSSGEISQKVLKNSNINYTTNPDDLKEADFHIISVPTPITKAHKPDLSMLLSASESIGKQLKLGDIVVYESSVYPGATEEKCIPVLEKASQLICGKDFSVGYSPERINPSDKEHNFENIIKIISAIDHATLDILAAVYTTVVKAGVYRVSSIRIAEATKVIENTQRDLNISIINEIALILHCIGMDSYEVLAAARTKWNFLPFTPGLVGGHCIGVNSYYLTYKVEEAGCYADVIQAGRRVNNSMPKFIADTTIKKLIHLGIPINKARIAVLGLGYKENCSDLHDTKVINLITELQDYNTEVWVHDPLADKNTAKKLYGIVLQPLDEIKGFDAVILAVAHEQYVNLDKKQLQKMLNSPGLIMDVKGVLNPINFMDTGITLWRL